MHHIIEGRTLHSFDIIEVDGFLIEPSVADPDRCRIYFNRVDGLLYYSEDEGPYKPFNVATNAQYLVVTRVLKEISAVRKMVTAINGTDVVLGQSTTAAKARVLGMTLTAGVVDDTIPILLFGNHSHASYTYTLNKGVYLRTNGDVSETPPATGWQTTVASSNGTGSIFVNIDEPIEL